MSHKELISILSTKYSIYSCPASFAIMQSNIRRLRSDKNSLLLSLYEVSGIKIFNEYKGEFNKLQQNYENELTVYLYIIYILIYYYYYIGDKRKNRINRKYNKE